MSVNQMKKIRKNCSLLILISIVLLFYINTYAKDYSIDWIHIDAEILSDGSLQIEESRTYTFDGEYTWADYSLPLDRLGTVRLFSLREGSQNYYESSDELPGSYYTEINDNNFYVKWFYRAKDQTRTFILQYLITDVVTVYNDVAEFYYKFIGQDNKKTVGEVYVKIKLPGYATKDSVKIWAHGPLHGSINFNDGNIDLIISPQPKNEFLETRVIFPPSWVSLSQQKISTNKREFILAEEKKWADEANIQREKQREYARLKKENVQRAWPLSIALSVIGFVVIIMMYQKYGKPFAVPYNLKIDSDLPRNIHPTILNCLYNNKQVRGSALSTTIFDLAQRDIMAIEQLKPADRKWFQPKIKYVFKLNRLGWSEIRSKMKDFENDLIQFFFDDLGNGEDRVRADVIKKSATKTRKWFEGWKKLLKAHIKHVQLYEKKSVRATTISAIFSGLIIVGAVLILVYLGYPGIISLAFGLICFAASFSVLRYTKEMKLKRKKWTALREYIKKYHFIKESDLSWQTNAGEYLVYGLALGVGQQAIKKLISTIPENQHGSCFPWYICAHGSAYSSADFAQAVTSTINTVSTTISSAAGTGGGASTGGGGGAGGASGGAG